MASKVITPLRGTTTCNHVLNLLVGCRKTSPDTLTHRYKLALEHRKTFAG